ALDVDSMTGLAQRDIQGGTDRACGPHAGPIPQACCSIACTPLRLRPPRRQVEHAPSSRCNHQTWAGVDLAAPSGDRILRGRELPYRAQKCPLDFACALALRDMSTLVLHQIPTPGTTPPPTFAPALSQPIPQVA